MIIAVVGTGSIGRRHLTNLIALGCHEVIAVSEHQKLDTLEINGLKIPVYHDFSSLLESDNPIDAVFICNPSSMHADYLVRSVAAGKNVYLEKPVAVDLDQIIKTKDFTSPQPVIVAVGNQFRFHPHLVSIKNKIQSGALGEILSAQAVQGEHLADYHPGEDYRQSYAARRELGGGVLLTQIHQIDYLNWLLGPFESVVAVNQEKNSLGLDVEENVSYLLRNTSGVIAYGHVDYLRRPKQAALVIAGTKGTIEWSFYDQSLKWVGIGEDVVDTSYNSQDRNQLFYDAALDFLESIEQQREPRSTLTDGINSLAIVDAIKQSIASNEPVRIKAINELS